MGALPSALDLDLAQIVGQRGAIVFLDYDGVLTPIVPRPEDAVLSPQMRDTLATLAQRCPVAVVSGRDLADVRQRVDLPGLAYAGSHGFDFVTADGREWHHPEAMRFVPMLDHLEAGLTERLRPVAGAQVERKRFSLSAHYRRVATADLPEFERAVREVASAIPGLRHELGKMVHDFRPALDWHKGKALQELRQRLDGKHRGAVTIYVGDDRTDEDAFAVLSDDDLGVFVGSPAHPTKASYVLRDPLETQRFLEALAQALSAPHRLLRE